MNIKNLLNKNLVLVVFILIAGSLFIAPRFLHETQLEKTTEQSSQTSKSTSDSSNSEEVVPEKETSSENQVQGAVSENTTPSNKTKPSTPKQQTNSSQNQPSSQTPAPGTSTNEAGEPVKHQVTLNIDNNSSAGVDYTYKVDWTSGMKVYDVLTKASSENSFELDAKWYRAPLNSYYVTNLHGYSCECWMYKINSNKCSSLGASLVSVNEDDVIYWSINNICS